VRELKEQRLNEQASNMLKHQEGKEKGEDKNL
jgi:hypothetical protein